MQLLLMRGCSPGVAEAEAEVPLLASSLAVQLAITVVITEILPRVRMDWIQIFLMQETARESSIPVAQY